MLKNFIINKINKKFEGKELYFCNRIYDDITFYSKAICKCCHCTKMPYSPPIIKFGKINHFSIIEYLTKIEKIMNENQGKNSPCNGCRLLRKEIVPHLSNKGIIKFFTINNFSKCNSNCVYCSIQNKTKDPIYKILPIIKEMYKQKLFAKECLINWGGGEPTICPDFEEICKFFIDKNIHQAINSSGIKFSQTVLDGLKTKSLSIQISPDSGTKETYTKIKRQSNFDKVWGNIKKYAQYPDMLFVKYIFFSWNATENEVCAFIEKCKENNVKNIVIDCESNSASNPRSPFGNITDEIVNLAILMKKLAIKNNMNYQISYQWLEKDKKHIEEN